MLTRTLFVLLLAWAASPRVNAQTNSTAQRLDRRDLMHYRNPAGKIVPIKSVHDWQRRRVSILAAMQEVLGPLPGAAKRTPLQIETAEEVDCGTYIRRSLSYAPEPKSRIPAFLLIPKAALSSGRQFPAALCLHPTDDRLGHQVVVGLGGKQNRDYARELAERGYVTIAPAYPKLANYQPDLRGLGYESGTMKAIWDNIRALDLLETLPFVRPGRFAAIGHSLGGHNSIFTAVFDQRIHVVVSSCGFDSFADYMNGNITGWTSDRYMPKLLQYRPDEIPFDFYELIGALAPRALFVSAPFYDSNFKWRSVYAIEQEARQIYKLNGRLDRMRFEYPNCAHDFPQPIREMAYEFMDAQLK
jgi:hypothetical protein